MPQPSTFVSWVGLGIHLPSTQASVAEQAGVHVTAAEVPAEPVAPPLPATGVDPPDPLVPLVPPEAAPPVPPLLLEVPAWTTPSLVLLLLHALATPRTEITPTNHFNCAMFASPQAKCSEYRRNLGALGQCS